MEVGLGTSTQAILFCEILYYFDDYKKVLKSFSGGPRFVIAQNVSKFHKQVEKYMIELGYMVKVSSEANAFGLGVYEWKEEGLQGS
jgi:hypothetical protein